jgi:hypothetical protein
MITARPLLALSLPRGRESSSASPKLVERDRRSRNPGQSGLPEVRERTSHRP